MSDIIWQHNFFQGLDRFSFFFFRNRIEKKREADTSRPAQAKPRAFKSIWWKILIKNLTFDETKARKKRAKLFSPRICFISCLPWLVIDINYSLCYSVHLIIHLLIGSSTQPIYREISNQGEGGKSRQKKAFNWISSLVADFAADCACKFVIRVYHADLIRPENTTVRLPRGVIVWEAYNNFNSNIRRHSHQIKWKNNTNKKRERQK